MRYILTVIVLFLTLLAPLSVRADTTEESSRTDHIKAMISQRISADKTEHTAAAPALPTAEDGALGGNGMKVFEGLVLCLAVFCFGIVIYRKITGVQPVGRGSRLRMIERISLAPKTSLVLAEVDGREVVLAVGSEHVAFMDFEPLGLKDREYLCEPENEERLHTV